MNFIRRIIRSLLYRLVPEFRALFDDNIAFGWIKESMFESSADAMTKIYAPYDIKQCNIGTGTYISANSKISRTTIGKFCSIGPNLVCGWGIHPTTGISTSPYFYSTMKQNGYSVANKNLIVERKNITIGNDVFIGANVFILDGVTIGNGAVIGAGSVVSKNIPEFAIAVGVPIQIKKYRFSEKQREKLSIIKWWDMPLDEIKDVNKYFFDVDSFINELEK